MNAIVFDSWETIFRTALMAIMAYPTLLFFLRISGNRTLAKMNAFDLVVTVSLGSALATVLLNKNVTLAQGALALALLIGMQFIITWLSVHAPWVRKVVTGEPALLMYQGALLWSALHINRVTEGEVMAAVRSAGLDQLDDIEAVVLETDGSFSVVQKNAGTGASSLKELRIP